jgi:hypothetical protein
MAILILTTLTSATEARDRRPICLLDVQILGTGAGLLCEDDQTASKVVDTSCQAFEPIRYSKKDTDETIRQAREHNAAWDALCKGK